MAPRTVRGGDRIKVHYTGTLEDGSVFDSSRGHDPFSFQVGGGEVIDGFDAAVQGLEVGGKRKVTVAPEQAYGEHDEDLVVTVPLHIFGGDAPREGDRVSLKGDDGETFEGAVESVGDEGVIVDLNHPLAGENLTFEIELLEILK